MNKCTDISMIYPPEDAILVNDKFLKNLDERRKRRYVADKKLLDKYATIDLNNINDLPDGKIRIDIKGARFECFFHKGRRKKLYIILDGARTHSGGKKREIPIYLRWSWYPYADYSWLCIEDPMYYDNDELTLGWFYGDTERNYRSYVAQIAKKISNFLNIEKDDVVFYGPSGGGTAAIHSAALFDGGVAVSINGQINFETKHKNIDNFKRCTGIDLYETKDKYNRNDLCKVMQDSKHTKFILVENCRSRWDFEDHVKYFCKRLDIDPPYGIERHGNIYTYIYDANGKSPHTSFEDKNIFFALDFLTELAVNDENIERYKPLYLLFNEFWHDLYEKKQVDHESIPEIIVLDKCDSVINKSELELKDMFSEVRVIAENDKYANWSYRNFLPNRIYNIKLTDLRLKDGMDRLDCGIFDYDKKRFIKKMSYSLTEKISFSFVSGDILGNIGFCVFAGEHGKTQGNSLTIGNIQIFATTY